MKANGSPDLPSRDLKVARCVRISLLQTGTQEGRTHFVKGTDKSNGTSPDAPNKKRRLVPHASAIGDTDSLLVHATHSASNSVSEPIAPIPQAVKNGQNGVAAATTAAVQGPPGLTPQSNGLYTSNVKDPSEIKSPQLPFGENVAVATGVAQS